MDDYDLGRRTAVLVDAFWATRSAASSCSTPAAASAASPRARRQGRPRRRARHRAAARGRNAGAVRLRRGRRHPASTGLASDSFDAVLSSEAVEHTPIPRISRRAVSSGQARRGAGHVDAESPLAGAGPRGIGARAAAVRWLRELPVAARSCGRCSSGPGPRSWTTAAFTCGPFRSRRCARSRGGWIGSAIGCCR